MSACRSSSGLGRVTYIVATSLAHMRNYRYLPSFIVIKRDVGHSHQIPTRKWGWLTRFSCHLGTRPFCNPKGEDLAVQPGVFTELLRSELSRAGKGGRGRVESFALTANDATDMLSNERKEWKLPSFQSVLLQHFWWAWSLNKQRCCLPK